jgi:hypothetical protein
MGMASRTNGQAPRGGPGSADPRSFWPIQVSADPRWAPLGVCFLGVAVLWDLPSVPGVHVLLRRFRRPGGPWIHVKSTCHALIRRGLPPLDW